MNEVYFIIFPILSCIPFALFYFYERIIARNRVKNAAFLFMGVILGGLTVFGLQLPVLVNNPTFNRFINQFLEILGSDSGQQISSQNTTPTPSVPQTNINTTSDDEEEEDTDDDIDNNNNTDNTNNNNQASNRRVYETTFTIPIDQNYLFNDFFNNQFSSMLNQVRQRRAAATNTRRTRFPTNPPNSVNNNNTQTASSDNNDINNTD